MEWSRDGERLATATSGDTAKVWGAETGKELLTLGSEGNHSSSLAWSPDGRRLATGGSRVKVWDVETGKELLALSAGAGSVAWSPDGKRLAMATYNGAMQVWEAETGKQSLALAGPQWQ